MSTWRKKPLVIEAFKWTGGPDQTEDPEWAVEAVKSGVIFFEGKMMKIDTLEGTFQVSPGDYVIKGINGELYPCKPDIFEKTYAKVEA